jgi:pyruvate kinase
MPNVSPPQLLTKILATVGPACNDADTLTRMLEEGARLFRVNFSHGKFADFEASVAAIREAADRTGLPVGILGDLSGPKIRVTSVEGGAIELAAGDHVEFPKTEAPARRDPQNKVVTVGTTYPEMVDDAEPGQRLLINDGAIRLLITDKVRPDDEDTNNRDPQNPRLICRVTEGGKLTDKKGVNLPDTIVSAPALTEWDEACAEWAVKNELDFLALSFVRKADDVRQLNALLLKLGRDNRSLRSHSRLPIVSKLEKPQAIDQLDEILKESDAVMVARGDLGVEMDLAQVPIIQKRIIRRAHEHGKPVIVATQMLESMTHSFTPTRAEVSDVANAILDGTDAIMLSGETAVGEHPIQAVHTMARTARLAEQYDAETRGPATRPPSQLRDSKYRTAALAHGVSTIVKDLHPAYVAMWSELGGGARYLSQNRLQLPILGISSTPAALRQMSILFGVHPTHMDRPGNALEFLNQIDRLLLGRNWAKPGESIVIIKGEPLGTPGVTNEVRIHYVGDVCQLPAAADEPRPVD